MKRMWKSLDDVEVSGQRVLTRLDLNVPMEDGKVSDDTRIRRAHDTVSEILRRGGVPVLMSHLGRPGGVPDKSLSLKQLVPVLERCFGTVVRFCPETVGAMAEEATRACGPGEIFLLENLRFNPGESRNDDSFSAQLAGMGDVYCNDAFSAAHRAHSSVVGVARFLPACAGRQMERELGALDTALGSPDRPVMAIVGGSKISTKLKVLNNLVRRVDHLVIGGAMANTFMHAKGLETGRSLVEQDMSSSAIAVLESATALGCRIELPVDVVVSRELKKDAPAKTVAAAACPADMMILDAGIQSVERIVSSLAKCRTLVWNGPVGAFEIQPFDAATNGIAAAAARNTANGALVSVAGGGDTVSALARSGVVDEFTYVSTAGGAFLEWMEGRTLPGIAALAG